MPRGILTEGEAAHATAAPEYIAAEIVREGLAKVMQDVVLHGDIVFARAYLADGQKASFYLRVGNLQT